MRKKLGLASLLVLFILAGCRINTAPRIATFTASPSSGDAPLTVDFTIIATDADGDPLTCTLNYGDGSPDEEFSCTSAVNRQHVYYSGNYTATLEVSDGRGGNDTASLRITVLVPPLPDGACPLPYTLSLSRQAVEANDEPHGLGTFEDADYVPGQLLVYQGSQLHLQSVEARRLENSLGIKQLSAPDLPGWVRYKVPEGSEKEVAAQILNQGLGVYAQPNYRYIPITTPNDPLFPSTQSNQEIQYGFMQITQAWDELPANPCRPIVGVIDSGVAYDHPDLDKNVVKGYDLSDDDDDPYPAVDDVHGTMVASIIGAETNNNQGMAGVTDNVAYVMPLKVFPNATSQTIANAITWAHNHGVHVFNFSLCISDSNGECADLTNNPDATIEDALQDAYNNGIVSLAASGNYNDNFVGYPASSVYTIAVGATDNSNPPERADEGDWCPSSDPNCGYGSNYGNRLDVMAPGTEVLGAGIPTSSDSEPYYQGNGTSFASPYAAGVAALYISKFYSVEGFLPSPSQISNCMRSAAQDLGAPGVDDETGAGLVRADHMLDTTNSTCYP